MWFVYVDCSMLLALFCVVGLTLLSEARRSLPPRRQQRGGLVGEDLRGKILHSRNRHLGNHRGFSVAFSDGCSVACSNKSSLVSGMLQRIVTFPVDFHWNPQMDLQWHSPIELPFCDFRRVTFCPEQHTATPRRVIPLL